MDKARRIAKVDRQLVARIFAEEALVRRSGAIKRTHLRLASEHGINVVYATVRGILSGENDRARGRATTSRHALIPIGDRPAHVLPVKSRAIWDKRTLYLHAVRPDPNGETVLKSGMNSPKIGAKVLKGRWRGMPIYTLTLEERATCPTSCRHFASCLVPGTRILMADLRWAEIGSLSVGDRIAAFDEYPKKDNERRRTRIAAVRAVGRAILPSYRITTDHGAITASSSHLWLVRPGKKSLAIDPDYSYRWRRTDALSIGDKIPHLFYPWDDDRSYEGGRLRGFLEGEGCVSTIGQNGYQKARVGWSQRPGRLFDEINDLARAKGYKVRQRINMAGVNHSEIGMAEIAGGWREGVRFLGSIRPTRLIEKAESLFEGHDIAQGSATPAIVTGLEFIGDQEVVMIKTSTRTLIADGFASHNCFGNKMQWAIRFTPSANFERQLVREVLELNQRHPDGFVIRLHQLGDFYSVLYVHLWQVLLEHAPALRVFGYTARWEDQIGHILRKLATEQWERFAMRFSNAPSYWTRGTTVGVSPPATISIEHPIQTPQDSFLCPEQTGRTESCATCGACWSTRKRVAFLQH